MSFIGEEIRHVKYGVGSVLRFEKRESDFLIEIKFINEEKTLFANPRSSKSFEFLNKEKQTRFLEFIQSLIPPPPPPPIFRIDEDAIRKLLQGSLVGRNVSLESGRSVSISKEFKYRQTYGRKAISIYDSGIEFLGFRYGARRLFDMKGLLYCQNCTPEGYSVWMLPHSELNGESNGAWANFVDFEKNEIIEYAFIPDHEFHPKDEKRLAFVKQKNGEYVFLGVYELKAKQQLKYGERVVREEIYSLVSMDYKCKS